MEADFIGKKHITGTSNRFTSWPSRSKKHLGCATSNALKLRAHTVSSSSVSTLLPPSNNLTVSRLTMRQPPLVVDLANAHQGRTGSSCQQVVPIFAVPENLLQASIEGNNSVFAVSSDASCRRVEGRCSMLHSRGLAQIHWLSSTCARSRLTTDIRAESVFRASGAGNSRAHRWFHRCA